MAKFQGEVPNELMKMFEDLETNCENIFGEMCKAGAETVYSKVHNNMEKAFADTKT